MTGRSILLGLAVAATVSAGAAVSDTLAPNYSSHGAGFFHDLLAGRVWLHERPNSARAGDRNTLWGSYYGPDGTVLSCVHLDGAWAPHSARWRMVPSPRFRALYNYYEAAAGPDPARVSGHVPIFHDPETGLLHTESLSSSGEWFVLSRGWVQENWPRALKDACPDLDLPGDLPVNEKQISARMDEAIVQDPDAAVRGLPGSDLRAPGSTGLALSEGGPTLTAAELGRFLVENDGRVLTSPEGARLVLVLGPERDELWRLDARGDVADTGWFLPSADGAEIVLQWERLPQRRRYRIGDPFPLLPTDERYAAMRLMDWILARDRDVGLPFMDRENVAFRFAAGGRATARTGDGEEVAGRWRWTRGGLRVALDGVAEAGAYPWRAFARRLGWTPNGAAADPAE